MTRRIFTSAGVKQGILSVSTHMPVSRHISSSTFCCVFFLCYSRVILMLYVCACVCAVPHAVVSLEARSPIEQPPVTIECKRGNYIFRYDYYYEHAQDCEKIIHKKSDPLWESCFHQRGCKNRAICDGWLCVPGQFATPNTPPSPYSSLFSLLFFFFFKQQRGKLSPDHKMKMGS